MPNLLRRVAALTIISAVGIALLAPLAVQSARPARGEAPAGLLDGAAGSSVLDRGAPGREQLSALTLVDQRAVDAPESFVTRQQPLPTPGSAPMEATLFADPAGVPAAAAPAIVKPPKVGDSVSGLATWYCCSSGYRGQAVVALPGALGGHYDAPPASRTVTICADRCAELPVVDYCGCLWGTADQKVADLSPEAWAAISNRSTSAGVITVTVHLD
ncbi:MAG TPA: hypothetical protein VFY43_05360 [Candidatus Limnocylindria bacterium]|nr:hypothetical protein [Candidatus Limnocylindria bacterium]